MACINIPQYVKFLPEMYTEYEQAVFKMRKALAMGSTYAQACNTLDGIDKEMKDFVEEDFLKVLIAEEHFGGGVDISDMALFLGLPYEKVESSLLTLLYDMVNEDSLHKTAMSMPVQ